MRRPGWLSGPNWHHNAISYLLNAIALILAVIALFGTFGKLPIQLGNVAEWFAAAGTVAAVSVAIWIAGLESRRHEDSQRREQAESVAAWASGHDVGRMRTVVSNNSKMPIYDVILEPMYHPTPGSDAEPSVQRTFIEVVPPGQWAAVALERIPSGLRPTKVAVPLAFTDARGNHWRRSTDGGNLEELTAAPLASHGDRDKVKFVKRLKQVHDIPSGTG